MGWKIEVWRPSPQRTQGAREISDWQIQDNLFDRRQQPSCTCQIKKPVSDRESADRHDSMDQALSILALLVAMSNELIYSIK